MKNLEKIEHELKVAETYVTNAAHLIREIEELKASMSIIQSHFLDAEQIIATLISEIEKLRRDE